LATSRQYGNALLGVRYQEEEDPGKTLHHEFHADVTSREVEKKNRTE